jgi:hypothetical protein
MKKLSVIAILDAVQGFNIYSQKYMQYLSQQGKSYNSIEEFNMRLENFIITDKLIEEWNA